MVSHPSLKLLHNNATHAQFLVYLGSPVVNDSFHGNVTHYFLWLLPYLQVVSI